MGFKASMIIIKDPLIKFKDFDLLSKLGFHNASDAGETTLEECIYPNDKSLNVGEFNNCIIICDDYQLTTSLELSETPNLLSDYERILTELFHGSEILTTACHSTVNYHLYSLVKDGIKRRFKKVIHGEPLVEYGDRMKEEEEVYAHSKIINGQRLFTSNYSHDGIYDNTEDQMMEDFAFGIAARHLGVKISTSADEELMFNTTFRKYFEKMPSTKSASSLNVIKEPTKSEGSWFSRLFKKKQL